MRFMKQFPKHERSPGREAPPGGSRDARSGIRHRGRNRSGTLIRDYPQHTDLDRWRTRRGAALQGLGKHDEAAKELAAAAEHMKSNEFQAEAIYRAAVSQSEQGDRDAAMASLQSALDKEPDNPQADRMLLLLASLEKQQDHPDQAVVHLRVLRDRFPDSDLWAQATFQLAEVLYAAGDLAGADPLYDEVISSMPPSEFVPLALYGRAWVKLRQGKPESSVSLFLACWNNTPIIRFLRVACRAVGLPAIASGSTPRDSPTARPFCRQRPRRIRSRRTVRGRAVPD